MEQEQLQQEKFNHQQKVISDQDKEINFLVSNDTLCHFFNSLYKTHTCLRCIFRQFKIQPENFYVYKINYPRYLKMIGDKISEDLISQYDEENLIIKQEQQQQQEQNDLFTKNSCVICYGLLQHSDKEIYIDQVVEKIKATQQEFSNWKSSFTFPRSMNLRTLQLLYFCENQTIQEVTKNIEIQEEKNEKIKQIQNKLHEYVTNWAENQSNMKFTMKALVTEQLQTKLNAPFVMYDGKAEIALEFINTEEDLIYFQKFEKILAGLKNQNKNGGFQKKVKLNNKEAQIMEQFQQENADKNNGGRIQQVNYNKVQITKTSLDSILTLSKYYFFENILESKCPQQTQYDTQIDIKISHADIILQGNYLKYSRYMPQSKWFDLPTSVADEIMNVIRPHFECESFNFMGGGREDVDVRMLGEGRPFIIELHNCKRAVTTIQEGQPLLEQIQEKINQKRQVNVTDLKFSGKERWIEIENSQREKIKAYACFIEFEKPINSELLNKLNDMKDIEVKQKTPVRVLHRRSPLVRDKVIHALQVYQIDDKHAVLYVLGSAGTYIKEFVHGDFERTLPNIGSLTQNKCDIFQLDVFALYEQIDDETLKKFREGVKNPIFQ